MRTAVRPILLLHSLKFYLLFSFFWWHLSIFPLQEVIKNKKEGFMQQNEEASIKYCQAKLDALSKALMESISAGAFSVPGGHKLYREAMDRLQQDYCQAPRKGVKVRNKGSMESLQNRVQGVSWKSESKTPCVGNERAWGYHDSSGPCCAVAQSCLNLWHCRLQHVRLPWLSPSLGVCSNSCPLSPWCHPTISSSVIPFSSCLQLFSASGSFLLSRLFTSGSQINGALASASVLPVNI